MQRLVSAHGLNKIREQTGFCHSCYNVWDGFGLEGLDFNSVTVDKVWKLSLVTCEMRRGCPGNCPVGPGHANAQTLGLAWRSR